MKTRLTRALLVGTGAVTAMAVGLTSASAVTYTYTVSAGTAKNAVSVPITGTTTGTTPKITFNDVTAGLPLTCDTSTVPGATKVSTTPRSGLKLGTITGTGAKFTNCKGPFGLAFVVTGSGVWNINATGKTTPTGATAGNISLITAHVADGTTCVFDVKGTVAGTYRNGTSTTALSSLTLPGTAAALTLSGVSGSTCALAGIKNGDKASFKGAYSLKANTLAYNPVKILGS